MAITSTSTPAEIKAEIFANLDYDLTNSVEKCKACILACRWWNLTVPKRMRHGGAAGDEYEHDTAVVSDVLKNAERWLAANDTSAAPQVGGGGVVFMDLSEFRR